MSVPTPLVVLFYVWLLVSVGILIYRIATRNSRRATIVRADDTDRAHRVDWGPPPGPSPADGPPLVPHPAPPTPPVAPAPSPASVAPARRTDLPPATTLIEALAGITMPCDLLPLTSVEGRVLGERELLLVTSGHQPEDVGEAFASALEALGYAITPMGPVTVMATRGPDRITVILHERPHDELSGKRSAFPTTSPGDVVLELRL